MIIQEMLEKLEADFPLSKAESWDNSGLQAGRRDKEIQKVFIALDPTNEIVEEAVKYGADLLLTHHPMTLSGLKKINTDNFASKKFFTAIQNDLCCYAMHTNYDVVEMATSASELLHMKNLKVLEVTGEDEEGCPEGIGRIGELEQQISLRELAGEVKKAFHLNNVKVFGSLDQQVQKIAICPGSGKSLMQEVIASGCEVYVTGDIGHHDGLDAMEQGIAVIDAGHYGVEHIFIENMKNYLNDNFPKMEIMIGQKDHPFQVI